MTLLVLGLAIFLGVHSVRIVAEPWRLAMRERLGASGWKGVYSLLSLAGLLLIVWGYGAARLEPVPLWTPMAWTRHLAALLMLVAFVLLAAAYVPKNAIKARWRHPMVLAVKVWALAHLLANHTLADLLLFGSFLVWAVFSFRAARRRDRSDAVAAAPATLAGTLACVVVGALAFAVFALWAHAALFGVAPFAVRAA